LQEAEDTYAHVPLLETFVQFQLMTAARRSETLTLTWANVDLEAQTAYLPETKNGRARKLALRSDLVKMLRQLPRTSELVFPIGVDGLRKAWLRICQKTGLTGSMSYVSMTCDMRRFVGCRSGKQHSRRIFFG
jgi:integrase